MYGKTTITRRQKQHQGMNITAKKKKPNKKNETQNKRNPYLYSPSVFPRQAADCANGDHQYPPSLQTVSAKTQLRRHVLFPNSTAEKYENPKKRKAKTVRKLQKEILCNLNTCVNRKPKDPKIQLQ